MCGGGSGGSTAASNAARDEALVAAEEARKLQAEHEVTTAALAKETELAEAAKREKFTDDLRARRSRPSSLLGEIVDEDATVLN